MIELHFTEPGMPAPIHHHHHEPGVGHPAAAVAPSMLRMGVLARLAVAAIATALIWAAAIWAMA
jgi:hypothetical protein